MTRDQVNKLLPIIKAFGEGKTIQYKSPNSDWLTADKESEGLAFHNGFEYRIKPEPREFWLIKWKDGGISAYNNLQYDTSRPISHINFDEQIHVKEVLD